MDGPGPQTSGGVLVSLSQHRDRGWTLVRVSGEVCLSTRVELGASLDRITTGEPPPPRLIVDVSGVSACDAVGLGALSVAYGRATQQYGGQMRLVCAEARMLRVLSVTGLSRAVPVYLTTDEALRDAARVAPLSGRADPR